MSDSNRYEDELRRQMEDLPLPDMNNAWQQMERRLDDEDRKRRLLPPFVLNCLGIALGLLLLLAGAWYFWWNTDSVSGKVDRASNISNAKKEQPLPPTNPGTNSQSSSSGTVPTGVTTTLPTQQNQVSHSDQNEQPDPVTHTGTPGSWTSAKSNPSQHVATANTAPVSQPKQQAGKQKPAASMTRAEKLRSSSVSAPAAQPGTAQKATGQPVNGIPLDAKAASLPADMPLQTASGEADSAVTMKDTAAKKTNQPVPTDSSKKQTPAKQKKIYFTAGIGLQQMIPLAGQSSVPYNKYGRTASLSDYLPSVYLRMHRGKWFLQAEFRYGAPQSVKEFSFAQRTKFDTSTNNLSVTNTVLRKTYYHQLPITLNYQVHKNVSVGVGGMYSHFYGAVTQQDVRTQNVLTGQESFKSTIVPVRSFNDSFLYKSQVHLLVQADYHWKRFNLGLRYSTDLQPYIKYTMPDGSIRTEKNYSLQFFVRYRLFRF